MQSLNDDSSRAMPRDKALESLVDITTVLDKHGCTHWLSDGTLLGAIRENDFIAHDYDIDLGVRAVDFKPAALHELLDKHGFMLAKVWGAPEDGLSVSVDRDGIRTDLFLYYPCDEGEYYSYYYMISSTRAKKVDCAYPSHGVVRREFLGHMFWMPENPEEHLEAEYGPDWRTPNPAWNWMTDPHNKASRTTTVLPLEALRLSMEYLGLAHLLDKDSKTA